MERHDGTGYQSRSSREFQIIHDVVKGMATATIGVGDAEIVGNISHAGLTLPAGNRAEIFLDGVLVFAFAPSAYMNEGGLPFTIFTDAMIRIADDVELSVTQGWYRSPRITVTGNDNDDQPIN